MSIRLINQSVKLLIEQPNEYSVLRIIEAAARTCYKSQPQPGQDNSEKMYQKLWRSGHHSVLEHAHLSMQIVTSRAIGNELVRHRHTEQLDDVLVDTAISQESTRYCSYAYSLAVIKPSWMSIDISNVPITKDSINELCKNWSDRETNWIQSVLQSAIGYQNAIVLGNSPQEARDLLPLATKTEIVLTASIRQWIQIIQLRLQKAAHPDIQRLMQLILVELIDHGYEKLFAMFQPEVAYEAK